MNKKKYNLIVIGGGAAGIGAILAAHEQGVTNILLLEKEKELGGILNQCIHDGFGLHSFKEQLTGPEYAYKLAKLVYEEKIALKTGANVVSVESDKKLKVFIEGEGLYLLETKALVLATGSYERSAGAINLPGERSAGIFTAGQAQLLINEKGVPIGQDVFIVGSGDIGLIMARRLTLTGAKVHGVAEIMPYSSGLKRNIVQCLEDYNIPLYLSHKVSEVRGKPRIQEVDIFAMDDKGKEIPGTLKTFKVDTLLLAVGLIPYVTLAEKLNIGLGKTRGPLVNNYYQTPLSWFFVAGNALHIHDLADDAYFEGREAGVAVSAYLNKALNHESELVISLGKNIGYVIPNTIVLPPLFAEINIKLRVSQPLINHKIRIYGNDELLLQKFYPFLFPSELTIIKLKSALLKPGMVVKVEATNE